MINIQSTFIILTTLLSIPVSHAEKSHSEIINVDGREVLLNDNGSWQFQSTDRFATLKDGTQIRLKEDGSWQAIGNAPLQSKEQVRTTDLNIKLQKVVIEKYEKKVQKNTRVKTQTVFYIDLAYSAQAEGNVTIGNNSLSLLEVKDNNGKNYPVVSITPHNTILKADSKITVIIRVEKSPSIWNNVKSMDIIFKKGILGIKQPITLSQRVIDFGEEDVDGFKH